METFQIDKIFDVKKVEGKPINNYEMVILLM